MKILIYGFKPYGKRKENISEKVVGKIHKRKDIKKIVFPVKFSREIFLREIKSFKPEIVIGLGRCRGKKIRIERRAVNLKRGEKGGKSESIFKNRPKYLFVNLKLKKDRLVRISYNAGQYVCNFSMYVILDYCVKTNTKFAFIHIPDDYDLNKAVKFIEYNLSNIIKSYEIGREN